MVPVAAAPQIGAATGGAGSSAGLRRGGTVPGPTREEGAWLPPPPPPAPDRESSTTASAWRRRQGSPRAGLGAGAREERLTVKSQAKAQKTQRQEDSLPAPPPALRKDFPASVGWLPALPSCPRPAKSARPLSH